MDEFRKSFLAIWKIILKQNMEKDLVSFPVKATHIQMRYMIFCCLNKLTLLQPLIYMYALRGSMQLQCTTSTRKVYQQNDGFLFWKFVIIVASFIIFLLSLTFLFFNACSNLRGYASV